MRYFIRLTQLKDTFLVKQVFNECFANNTTVPNQQNRDLWAEFVSDPFNPYTLGSNQNSAQENSSNLNALINCKKNWKSKYEAEINEIMSKCTIPPPQIGRKGKIKTEQQISKWDLSLKKEKCMEKQSL